MSSSPLFELAGKVAIVTGGSRGLGREMALGFARAGADVVITSRKLDACESVAAEVRSIGRASLAYSCHAGRWDELPGLVDAAYERFGTVDILVNNAGKSPLFDTLSDVTEPMWDSVFAINAKGPFRLAVLVGSRMNATGGGSIINISASGTRHPFAGIAPYAAAKSAIETLTVALADAFAPAVRVNAIMPGAFRTDVSRDWSVETVEHIERSTKLGRIGDPSEIVGAALFLASAASSYTTGSIIRVDGGQ